MIANLGGIRLLRNDKNSGKGYAVKRGVLSSSGDIVVFSDADESVTIDELPKFVRSIEDGADVVIASRNIAGSSLIKRQALWRQTMGKIFNMFVRAVAFGGIKDTQCGFKCFRREAAKALFSEQKIRGFAFDVEILYLARIKGYKIEQLPVRWINSPRSTVDPIRDSIIMLRDLFAVKKLHKKNVGATS
jgi:dolichyl-phosphate beta-glucosyltransferase